MISFYQYLDNCISNVQMLLPMKGDLAMAKHRLRICVGYNDDGSPVVKRISGNTELELADNVVKWQNEQDRLGTARDVCLLLRWLD